MWNEVILTEWQAGHQISAVPPSARQHPTWSNNMKEKLHKTFVCVTYEKKNLVFKTHQKIPVCLTPQLKGSFPFPSWK